MFWNREKMRMLITSSVEYNKGKHYCWVLYVLVLVVLLTGIGYLGSQSHALTIEEIIELTQYGSSEKVIIMKIEEDKAPTDLTTQQILLLRKAGVSNKVIEYIMQLKRENLPSPIPPTPTDEVFMDNTGKDTTELFRSSNPFGCTLQISSKPLGAKVIINALKAGVTPFFSNQLEPGKVTVELHKDLYKPVIRKVKLETDKPVELNETLELREPTLVVRVMEKSEHVTYPWFWTANDGSKSRVFYEAIMRKIDHSSSKGEKVFVYDSTRSPPFKEGITTCIEIVLWFQNIRFDSKRPVIQMPKPDVKFFAGNIPLSMKKLAEVNISLSTNPTLDIVKIKLESEYGLIWTQTSPLITDLTEKSFTYNKNIR